VYTDTHCHLDYLDDGDPADTVLERARAAGVSTFITVGVDLATSVVAVQQAMAYPDVWAVVGIHPHNAIEATEGVLERLRELAAHPRVVGFGETGLDYFRDHSPVVRQEESFREHIRMAKDLDKALVIHDRDAHDDVVAILKQERAPERTVFHCFSGDESLAQICAENGWYMSFAGTVTFRNAPNLRKAAATAPLELIVAETDSPYLSPHPFRGQVNEPARVTTTVALLGELHGLSPEEMARHTSANAKRLFRLSE